MIALEHTLSIKRQAELVRINRGAVYDLPRKASEDDCRLMRRIDELHLEHPLTGGRMLASSSTGRASKSGASMWPR